MKIAVVSLKGGVGKTVCVTALSYACRAANPFLFDTDEQQSCLAFNWGKSGVSAVGCGPVQAANMAEQVGERLCFFDCPASLVLSAPILSICDAALVPVEADFLALRAVLPMQEEMERRFPALKVRYVLTRYIPSRELSRDIRDAAREQWGQSAFDSLCKTMLPSSADFGKCAANGETVLQGAPDSNAGKSMLRLLRELAPLWNLPL